MQPDPIDRPPTKSEVWAGRLLTGLLSLVFGFFTIVVWRAYQVRPGNMLPGVIATGALFMFFLIFFLRSVFTKPRRAKKAGLLAVFSLLTTLGCLGLWLAYSVGMPDSLPIYGYSFTVLALGVTGIARNIKRHDA